MYTVCKNQNTYKHFAIAINPNQMIYHYLLLILVCMFYLIIIANWNISCHYWLQFYIYKYVNDWYILYTTYVFKTNLFSLKRWEKLLLQLYWVCILIKEEKSIHYRIDGILKLHLISWYFDIMCVCVPYYIAEFNIRLLLPSQPSHKPMSIL